MPGLDLSIIIVSFNTRDYLKNCLDSIYKSDGMECCEVIVVDNCSADGSPEMVEYNFSQVHLIKPGENLGFARANNVGAKMASGRYLLFLNPDTVVLPDTFIIMIDFMDNKPKAGAANCCVLNDDGSVQMLSTRRKPTVSVLFLESLGINRHFPNNPVNRRYILADWDHHDEKTVEVISGAFFMIRANLYKYLGGFNDNYFMYVEDVELSERIRKSGYEIWFNPQTSIIHYGGKSSINYQFIATVNGINAIYHYISTYNTIFIAHLYKLLLICAYSFATIYLYFYCNLSNSTIVHYKIFTYNNILKYVISMD